MSATHLMRFSAIIDLIDPDTPTGEDEYGNPTYTPSQIQTKCYYEQQAHQEVMDPPGEIEQQQVLFMVPADVPINGWSAVTIEGVSFDVKGPPWVVRNPRSNRVSHVEASLAMSE